jgi:hypothetical protein
MRQRAEATFDVNHDIGVEKPHYASFSRRDARRRSFRAYDRLFLMWLFAPIIPSRVRYATNSAPVCGLESSSSSPRPSSSIRNTTSGADTPHSAALADSFFSSFVGRFSVIVIGLPLRIIAESSRFSESFPLRRRRLAPQPAQRIGQDRPAVLAVVAAVAPLHLVIVLLVLQR